MIFRLFASSLTVTGLVALGVGPVRVALDRNPADLEQDEIASIQLTDTPGQAPSWTVGLVDTKRHLPDGAARRVRRPESIDLETALRALGGRDVVSVIGGAGPARLAGVGAVVSEEEAAALAALPEPGRTDLLTYIADTDALGLSVYAVDQLPDRAVVVERDTGDARREVLEERHPAAAGIIDAWAQLRPDLRALVSRGAAPEVQVDDPLLQQDGSRARGAAWERAVERTVREEIFPAVDEGRSPVSPSLLVGDEALVVSRDGDPALSARGAAYAVAARALMPGSRLLPIRGGRDFDLRVVMRPDGRVAVLAWNPGPTAPLVIQLPDSGRAERFQVTLAGRSFTTVLLPG
jgi:hypothetical protein